jgi:flagellar protein FliS
MYGGYSDYQRTQAWTANRGELLLMLFDGAIRFTNKAIKSIEVNDIPKKCESISRAFAIVAELHGTLDFDVSEEIAGNLASLYVFVLEGYAKANAHSDADPLRGVLVVLETLRDGWVGAVASAQETVEGENTSQNADLDGLRLSVVAG